MRKFWLISHAGSSHPLQTDAKLNRLADECGGYAEELAPDPIEQLVHYDHWFVNEVETALDQLDRGQSRSHAQVGVRLEALLAAKKTPS